MDKNEAIKIIRSNFPTGRKMLCEALEILIPELKESEDEKIRKEILSYIKSSGAVTNPNWIAWLEKQDPKKHEEELENAYKCADEVQYRKGYEDAKREFEKQSEQKPEIKYIYPKFRVGDVIEPTKPNGHYVPVRVKYIGEGAYSCESDDRTAFLSLPICDENDYVLAEQNSSWSEEDEHILEAIIREIEANKTAGPEYDEKVYDMFLSWLKSLRPNKYVTWSEEDEKMFIGIISIVGDWYNSMSEKEKEYYGDCGYINWLKSLKQRMKGE